MELISKLEPLAEKQEVYKARLANLELPGKYTDTEEKITFLRQGLLYYRNHLTENAKLAEKLEQVTMQLDLVKQDLLLIKKEKADLLASANAKNEEEFRMAAIRVKEEQNWRERLVLIEAQLEPEKQIALNQYENQASIKEKELQLEETLRQIELEQEKNPCLTRGTKPRNTQIRRRRDFRGIDARILFGKEQTTTNSSRMDRNKTGASNFTRYNATVTRRKTS